MMLRVRSAMSDSFLVLCTHFCRGLWCPRVYQKPGYERANALERGSNEAGFRKMLNAYGLFHSNVWRRYIGTSPRLLYRKIASAEE
ncbi:uncharacterized protein BDZ99DRAFT_195956 [Mytilinidion resinicola]|uniref:Uncharacterized protein n=1 Tax=Mytilinidion resinicola TaxID=574789 RepID=A0A6A6Z362_9PEZI|nr:uncharacterized protein BDZ99DRAFT_195956 [Mytilinidion resinicola]KAF2815440.1 hypothetical protein BDZ99DRAFT_195956 [Mytilinidion resinicola]